MNIGPEDEALALGHCAAVLELEAAYPHTERERARLMERAAQCRELQLSVLQQYRMITVRNECEGFVATDSGEAEYRLVAGADLAPETAQAILREMRSIFRERINDGQRG